MIRLLNAYFPACPVLLGISELLLAVCAFLAAIVVYLGRLNLAYDLFYIKHISVGLDLLILFKAVKALRLGRGTR